MAGAVLQMRPQKGSSVSRRYCTEKNLPEESSIVLDMPMSYYHCQPTFTFYMHIPVIDIWKILSITKQIKYYLLKLSWLPAKIKLVKHSLIVLSSISEPSPFRLCKWPITLFSENCQREIRVFINKQCERKHMEIHLFFLQDLPFDDVWRGYPINSLWYQVLSPGVEFLRSVQISARVWRQGAFRLQRRKSR